MKKYEMNINYSSGIANYVISGFDLSVEYNVSLELQFRSRFDLDIPLILATAEQTSYQFAINKQLRFPSDQLDTNSDYDNPKLIS